MKKLLLHLLFVFVLAFNASASFRISDLKWAKDVGAKTVPFGKKIVRVANYGAVADGITLNTKAIQDAIDACSDQGGGVVTFDKGRYLTGSIYLKSGVHLDIPKGTIVLGSTNIEDYPEIDTRVAGIEMKWPSALINVLNQKNVMLSGQGIVHGQGKVFWDKYWTMRKEYEKKALRWIVDYDCTRPRSVLVSESSDVTIKDLTFQQAGFWTIQLLYSSYCTVDGVVIQNNIGGHGPSTDGVDIDSSSHILVENCDIDCNDDNFCLKAGRDADGLRVNRPTEYIVIRNCVSRAGGGLLTCGSETSGNIRYVLAHDLKAKGTSVGIRLKSAMNRGGTTDHIYIRDIEMDAVGTAFEATVNWNPAYSYSALPKEYEGKKLPDHWVKMLEVVDAEKGIPYFNTVYLSNFKITNSKQFLNVVGSKESLMKDFNISHINADVATAGSISFAQNWTFDNILIKTKDFKQIQINNSEQVEYAPEGSKTAFIHSLQGEANKPQIVAANHAEFAFYLPEMAGNLQFGIIVGKESKWLNDVKTTVNYQKNQLTYSIVDPLLGKGNITIEALALSNTDGTVIAIEGNNVPANAQLLWCYGGAYGKVISSDESGTLQPLYCKDNVFSVEQTAFTLYYGLSMQLKVIQGVMPVSSEIRLSDAFSQASPLSLFESGKISSATALAGVLPLKNSQKEYFCIYKQNDRADYNHYMLPALFINESKDGK